MTEAPNLQGDLNQLDAAIRAVNDAIAKYDGACDTLKSVTDEVGGAWASPAASRLPPVRDALIKRATVLGSRLHDIAGKLQTTRNNYMYAIETNQGMWQG